MTDNLAPKASKRDERQKATQRQPGHADKRHAKTDPALALAFTLANLKDLEPFDEVDHKLGEFIERHEEEHGPNFGPHFEKIGGWAVYQRAVKARTLAESRSDTAVLRRVLNAAMNKLNASGSPGVPTVAYIRVPVSLRRDDSGCLVVKRGGTLAGCLDAIQGIETRRIGHCRVCGDYFYARRLTQQGRAPEGCPSHAHAARARRYRANHDRYHHRRKMRGAGIDPGPA